MRHLFSSRALHQVGFATLLAGLPTAALGQAANPLGVEWVGGSAAANPASSPAAGNPLGVEWVGGDRSQPTPLPTATNPLGIEWIGGGTTTAKPTPSPTSSVRTDGAGESRPPAPQPPAPQNPTPQPPAPVPPSPDAAPPQSGASQSSLIAALIDSWMYQAVAFTSGSGTVSETRGVSGTLKFKADGQYEQALSIGGIANIMKGHYRIAGDRLETTYLWRGESVTDIFDLYLDPTGKRLTLAGLGSPKAHYTLQRVE